MKTIVRRTVRTLSLFALTLMMTVSALAAETAFTDIPADAPYAESVAYLAEQGITSGTGNNCFSPDKPITVRQWAVLLCRAYGLEVSGEGWSELSENCVNTACQKGWLSMGAVHMPDTKMCRSTLLESAFAAADITVYDSVLYPEGEVLSAADNLLRIGRELGLCAEDADSMEIVTRGETAQVLHAILTKELSMAEPPMPVALENRVGANINGHLLALRSVPQAILDAFNDRDWTYIIDFEYIDAYSKAHDIPCIGLTSYGTKTIYVSNASAAVHELGHFLDWILDFPAEHERLFLAEAENSILRDYAKTNAREYFAECFDYWLAHSVDAVRMEAFTKAAPQTAAYLDTLAANNWIIP